MPRSVPGSTVLRMTIAVKPALSRSARAVSSQTRLTWVRSRSPLPRLGVPTQTMASSLSRMAAQ